MKNLISPESRKAADVRPETTKEFAISSRGGLDSAAVLGEFLRSPQAAGRGTRQKWNSADLAASGESVGREFLRSALRRWPREGFE
jgi:hypothetical protein